MGMTGGFKGLGGGQRNQGGYFTGSSMSSGDLFNFNQHVSAKRTEDPRQPERISFGSNTDFIPTASNMAGKMLANTLMATISGRKSDDYWEFKNHAKPNLLKQESKKSILNSVSNHSHSTNLDGGENVDLDKVKSGEETRTNIMVKNIPCRYTKAELKADFENNHKNHFNDLKLPMDKENNSNNKSYCFMNFRHAIYLYDFCKDKSGYCWPKYASNKMLAISFAKEQPAPQNRSVDNMTSQDKFDL